MWHWTLSGVLAASLLALGSSALADEWKIDTKDGTRSAIVLPARQTQAPAVIVLHGAAISAQLTVAWTGFAEAAGRRGFAAAFPEGNSLLWNDGRGDGLSASDDVGFLRGLVQELVMRRVADRSRIYIAGISNGGMMTFRMLCEAPELFAGAATVIANMPAAVGSSCKLQKPMPFLMFNGTADPLVPYRGGGVGFAGARGTVWSAERSAAFVARVNGCASRFVRPQAGDPGPITVMRLDWSRCSSGNTVSLYRVEGGGHQVFGHTDFLPAIFGSGTSQVSAPEVIMAAFAKRRG
jgi:polyhydroxybutyrate depolymerase